MHSCYLPIQFFISAKNVRHKHMRFYNKVHIMHDWEGLPGLVDIRFVPMEGPAYSCNKEVHL